MRQFALFCVSGVIATAIDAGLTQAWVSLAGLDPWSARALAAPVAMTATWLFNRSITFRAPASDSLWREWMGYCLTQLSGLGLNLGLYALLVAISDTAARWPMLAVAVGSVAGLVANYAGAKHLVFAARGR